MSKKEDDVFKDNEFMNRLKFVGYDNIMCIVDTFEEFESRLLTTFLIRGIGVFATDAVSPFFPFV